MSLKLNIAAGTLSLPLEANGLVGGRHVSLTNPNGDWNLRIPLNSEFAFVSPGDRCIVFLSIVKVGVDDMPDELPGLPQLAKGKFDS